MTLRGRLRCALVATVLCLASFAARAQFAYDVPYVPTPHVVVEEMLRLANVKPDDFVMDLGSGDGRILIAAARKFGARGIGVDLDPDRIAESAYNAQLQGVPTTNLRKLAQELTPSIGPGDYVRVALTREGKETGQGVGHLDDGSMVVVNGGHGLVGGPEVMLQVTSVVPTAAGRLLFARLEDA